jgi:hypothetical protein
MTKTKLNSLILTVSLLITGFAMLTFESVAVQAITDDVTVNQSVTAGISITSPADVTMTALSTSQNTAVGTAVWTVTTNSSGGYTLNVHAGASPAMVRSGGGGNIADYTPAVSETPETWSVPSGNVEFGWSGFGTNVNTTTYGTDSDCIAGADVPSAALKWRDFDLTGSSDQIATSASPTSTSGTATNLCVATEQDGTFAQSGTYAATITATATAQ